MFSPATEAIELGEEISIDKVIEKEGAPQFQATSDVALPFTKDTVTVVEKITNARPLALRGRTSKKVYKNFAPSVVYIINKDSIGSGAYVSDDMIITNWHVVQDAKNVAVVFKPDTSSDVTGTPMSVGEVIKLNKEADLALIKLPEAAPKRQAFEFADAKALEVGDDVHAIGHPHGEVWTYTKGIVSQIRPQYDWRNKEGAFQADVVQTQTPINPGNSGGPLINDAGQLVGINSFGAPDAPGLNFAVAVSTVRKFLQDALGTSDAELEKAALTCSNKELYVGRTERNDGWVRVSDTDCDQKWDESYIIPDDKDLGIVVWRDSNKDGKVDVQIIDQNRDGAWDYSYHDTDADGKIDLVGEHADGGLNATFIRKYRG